MCSRPSTIGSTNGFSMRSSITIPIMTTSPYFWALKTALADRDLELKGITTDGSALYPEPIRKVFGDVRHQPTPSMSSRT